jgi:hypothetical protein
MTLEDVKGVRDRLRVDRRSDPELTRFYENWYLVKNNAQAALRNVKNAVRKNSDQSTGGTQGVS